MLVKIRVARLEDCMAILNLQKEGKLVIYPGESYGVTREDVLKSDLDGPEIVAKLLRKIDSNQETNRIWVAETGEGKIIGTCGAGRGEKENKIRGLFVTPCFQGRLIGRRLGKVALEWVGTSKPVRIEVVATNPVIRIYKKWGFTVIGTGENLSVPGKSIPTIILIRR